LPPLGIVSEFRAVFSAPPFFTSTVFYITVFQKLRFFVSAPARALQVWCNTTIFQFGWMRVIHAKTAEPTRHEEAMKFRQQGHIVRRVTKKSIKVLQTFFERSSSFAVLVTCVDMISKSRA
jgi:hypothetical protein